jgi:hypothetical protein
MTYFCPDCWKIIPAEVKTCPFCGCNLAAAGERSYPERLIGALHHPIPETRVLAAEILGELQYRPALAPLMERAREELSDTLPAQARLPKVPGGQAGDPLRGPERTPDIQFLAALLRSARTLGAPANEWQEIVKQANSRLLKRLLESEKHFHTRP